MRSIALIGAGYISGIHAQIISEHGFGQITAVVDTSRDHADALAQTLGIKCAFSSVEELVTAKVADVAHVLVPPPFHREVTLPLLHARMHVLLEKPMAESEHDCHYLQEAAFVHRVALDVNQNAVHHPAHRRLHRIVDSGTVGSVRHLSCIYNMPLSQLDSRRFGHWMFQKPCNILLEQAVHPLSQVDSILGPIQDVRVSNQQPRRFGNEVEFLDRWQIMLNCERGTAMMYFAVGQNLPEWSSMVICDDGLIHADYTNNVVTVRRPTKWIEVVDSAMNLQRQGLSISSQGGRNSINYLLSTFKLQQRTDPFYESMLRSIGAFYRNLETQPFSMNGALGRRLVAVCESIASQTNFATKCYYSTPSPQQEQYDVLIAGGTGFVGSHVVKAFLKVGKRVAVLARNTAKLPSLYHNSRVGVFRGNVQDKSALHNALSGSTIVVSLTHGGGAENWKGIEQAIVGGAKLLAEMCLENKVERFIYVSSIAVLDLSNPRVTIFESTPADSKVDSREAYSRAKAYAERELIALHKSSGLPVVILRPGIVVGEGGVAFHSGVGLYNHDIHCMGWNEGENPLPFVLVEDVAAAIVAAIEARDVVGRTLNLVGDIRLNAREYTTELSKVLQRPLRFHPQSIIKQQTVEIVKWLVKRAIGRAAPFPSVHDLKCRGLVSRFDTNETKRLLCWTPEVDRMAFIKRGIAVHAR